MSSLDPTAHGPTGLGAHDPTVMRDALTNYLDKSSDVMYAHLMGTIMYEYELAGGREQAPVQVQRLEKAWHFLIAATGMYVKLCYDQSPEAEREVFTARISTQDAADIARMEAMAALLDPLETLPYLPES